ncbi:SMI1/KNR4 family protein (plasmid) [Tenacibaculum finnmarkense]|nr:SMI1/KNR4 family protein [Tenacibaculum finnmarkense]
MNYFEDILEHILLFKKKGFKEFNNGAKLFGKAVHIASEAYSHKLFKPLNKDDIRLLENEINTKIPKEYKDFLLNKTNGLLFFVANFSLDGLRKQLGRDLEAGAQPFDLQTPNTLEKPKNTKEEYFFIGGYGYDASKLYIDKNTGKVHYCKRYDATSLFEWESFEEMISQETKRIFKLFDDKGVRLVPGKEILPC